MARHRPLIAAVCLLTALNFAANGFASGSEHALPSDAQFQPAPDDLVLYCGRSKSLIEPLVERFREQSGIQVAVRYGRDAQLLAMLQEEGSRSPADLFWANTTGALGAAIEADLLTELPANILQRPAAFIPSSGRWAPLTTRFRVLAYNTRRVSEADLPGSVMDLPRMARFEGRIGWTPTYSSFQDFITAMRITRGRDAALDWLKGVRALNPRQYSSNTPMIRALAAGEIDIALTNHYYVLRMKASDPQAPVALHHFEEGDIGNLALVTGAGMLKTADRREAARRFLDFLLSRPAQEFAAQTVHEYPVIVDATLPARLTPIDRALKLSPDFDFERLRELRQTLDLMREAGLF